MEKLLKIRKCVREDAEHVFRFICQLEGENPDRNDFDNVFLSNLEKPDIIYILGEIDSKIIGFASMHMQQLLHHTGKVAEIQELFIDSLYRNSGYGEQLLLHLRDCAENEGCRHFEASCNIVRDKTYNFFASRGMQPTHHKFTERL